MKRAFLATVVSLLSAAPLPAQSITPVQPEAINRWRDARFGMFIHWGPVSLTGKEIGWSRGAGTPVEEYDRLYQRFNPTAFSADEWVATAKAAGMRYIVLTTKHHDGFCLWDSEVTDYDITATPFKRDVVRELSTACKKAGIPFGVYYSTCDWRHPDFPLTSPGGKTVRPTSDLDRYTEYLKAQTRELLSYGPLFTIWYDVPQKFDATRGASVINMARSIQPDIVINNRTGHPGDYDTPEQRIGGFQIDRPWETCMTLCNQWSWKPGDPMKSLEQCLHTLIRSNGGDGNLLFNVGPEPSGIIEPRQVERLKEMGAWLAKHGESLYATRGGPWKPSNAIVSTRKGDKIYLHLLKKIATPVTLPALPVEIKSAKLPGGASIQTQTTDGSLSLSIPENAWDPIDTIVELTVAGNSMDIPPLNASTGSGIQGAEASASAVFSNQSEYAAAMAIDGDPDTRWATPAGMKQCWIEINLPKAATLSGMEIDEAMFSPQSRVRRFEIQTKDHDHWTAIHRGTSIGPSFKAAFAPVTTGSVRLNILDASDGPTISEIRLDTRRP